MMNNQLMTFSSEELNFSMSGILYEGKPAFDAVELAKSLGYPEKMFGRERKFVPVQLRPSGETGAVRIQFDPVINTTYGNPEFVVMPCRDDAFKIVEEHLG